MEGEWISVCEAPAPDSTANIDFVSFEHLTDPQTINIVIGWEDTRSSKTAIAYRYQNGRLTSIFERDYAEIAIADLDSNGTTDLCLLTPQAQSTLLFLACSTDSGFETVDSLTLPHGIVSFDSILAGRTANGQTALFPGQHCRPVRHLLPDYRRHLCQAAEDGSPALVNLLDNENLSLSKLTLRPMQNLFCRDIDNDSIIEIPTASTLPGYEDMLDEDALYLTTYNILTPNVQLTPEHSGVINTQHRYMLAFPQNWLSGKVSAVIQPENGELTFLHTTVTSWTPPPLCSNCGSTRSRTTTTSLTTTTSS